MIRWQCSEVLLHRKPVDFRKSVNDLSAIIEQEMGRDTFSGQVFVFCNKTETNSKWFTGTKAALRFGTNAWVRQEVALFIVDLSVVGQ